MIKRNIKKTTLLAACLLMLGSTMIAKAASYSFSFNPPYVGSIQHSSFAVANGQLNPYVDPSGTTNATTYVLTMPTSGSTTTVSSFVTNVTTSKTYMTYDSGFGGAGQSYKLTGYPSNYDFQKYSAAGTWQP